MPEMRSDKIHLCSRNVYWSHGDMYDTNSW